MLAVWIHRLLQAESALGLQAESSHRHLAGADLSNLVVVSVLQFGPAVLLCVGNVLAQLVVRDDVWVHLILCWPRSARLSILLTLRLLWMRPGIKQQ